MADARIQIAPQVKRGDSFEVKIAIRHAMETGYRVDDVGKPIKRNVIRALVCKYNGTEALRVDMSSGFAANPLLQFWLVAGNSGEISFEWDDDAGTRYAERAAVTVAG
ncbi:MAG: Sulfur oxidation protein SoxZ [Betaproteobacteria bacterium]|nr:Sulfur oxidation protein SoxZ [Betaproteobacteria bacterium]